MKTGAPAGTRGAALARRLAHVPVGGDNDAGSWCAQIGPVERQAGLGEKVRSTSCPRERSILALMAEGVTDRGIAERLWLARKTVETHVRRATSSRSSA